MKRRDFLTGAALLPALSVVGKLYAAPATTTRLLVVFLRGAYDATNVVIPVSSDFYYQSRPTLAIARPNPSDPKSSLPLDSDWALHPALAGSLYTLFQKKQAAFIAFAGTDDTSRSHFETQDTIERGQSTTGKQVYDSGFMSRLNDVLSDSRPIAFSSYLPLTFRGSASIPNIALDNTGKPGIAPKTASLIEGMYRGSDLAPAVSDGFTVQNEIYQTLSSEMQAASRNATTAHGFERSAQRIGVLMREKFNLGFVDVGGWDTHFNEGGADGYLAGRLGELGRGLASFSTEMGAAWNDTVVVVVSEFGRTFRENGDRGTDHGHGSAYWVLGGGIRGGRIAGDQIQVSQATLFQNRDYPVLNEYRAVLAALFERLYGLRSEQLQRVFPHATPKDIGLL